MICKSKWIAASTILLSMLFMQTALAGSMRCGTHIISTGGLHGPGKYEVLKKCGEPTVRAGDTWIYDSIRRRRLSGAYRLVIERELGSTHWRRE
jgi:hypothetical protein